MPSTRRFLPAACALALLGCATTPAAGPQPRDAGNDASGGDHTGSGFGGRLEAVLAQPASIVRRQDGALVITRDDRHPTTGAAIAIARDVHEGVEIDFGNGALIRVREDTALGSPAHGGTSVSHQREGGRSHWTVASEHALGFEEWLEIEPGLAYGDRILAVWEVVGLSVREVVETGGVHVLGSDGEPIAYVSAPRAWSFAGDVLTPRLSVESERIVLRVDAGGAAVLVDPLWVPTGLLSEERCFGPDGMVPVPGGALVAGGHVCGSVTRRRTVERYSSLTGVWSTVAAMSGPRGSHTTTVLADGRVLVVGGDDGSSYLATAEIYDPATDTWTGTGSMAAPRLFHSASLLHDGRVLVAGGWTGPKLATAEIYDPADGTWSATGSMAASRANHRAVTLLDGSVLVVGDDTFGASSELYDPATGAWTSAGAGRDLRSHGLTLLRDGRVLLTGGYRLGGSYVAQLWDPVTRLWSSTGRMSSRRHVHTATLLASGSVLVAGGEGGSWTSEIYDPTLGRFSDADSLNFGRGSHAAVLLATGRVVVAGGTNVRATATSELLDENVTCGDGVIGDGESCDDGNTESYDCCSSRCRIEPAGTLCRGSGCTIAECTGSSPTCPPSVVAPAGWLCRPTSWDPCDAEETCDGSSVDCPPNVFAPTTRTCRRSFGECDVAEQCTGTVPWCPEDAAQPEGTPCGGAPSGVCDVPDVCVGSDGWWAYCEPRYTTAGTQCREPSCSDGVETIAAACTGDGPECPPLVTNACAPFVCGAHACPTSCTTDGECASGHFCAGSTCSPHRVDGTSCVGDGECESGLCVDGVCCNTVCPGQCEACDVPGTEGTCVAVVGDPRGARSACTSDGTGCGGRCDGTLRDACIYPDATTTCRTASCTDGVAVSAARCDGVGGCSSAASTSCAPFACGPEACVTSCAVDTDCAPHLACVLGACVTSDAGAPDAGRSERDAGTLDAGRSDAGTRELDGGPLPPPAGVRGCGCTVPGPRGRGEPRTALALMVVAGLMARRLQRRGVAGRLRGRATPMTGGGSSARGLPRAS